MNVTNTFLFRFLSSCNCVAVLAHLLPLHLHVGRSASRAGLHPGTQVKSLVSNGAIVSFLCDGFKICVECLAKPWSFFSLGPAVACNHSLSFVCLRDVRARIYLSNAGPAIPEVREQRDKYRFVQGASSPYCPAIAAD